MATLTDVLQAVVTAIIASNPSVITAENCFFTLDRPVHPINPGTPEGYVILVYPGGGVFDQGKIAGGGVAQMTLEGNCSVEIFSTILLDQTGHDAQACFAAGRGVIALSTSILTALTLQNPSNIMRDPMRPLNLNQPAREKEPAGASLMIDFSLCFDWTI